MCSCIKLLNFRSINLRYYGDNVNCLCYLFSRSMFILVHRKCIKSPINNVWIIQKPCHFLSCQETITLGSMFRIFLLIYNVNLRLYLSRWSRARAFPGRGLLVSGWTSKLPDVLKRSQSQTYNECDPFIPNPKRLVPTDEVRCKNASNNSNRAYSSKRWQPITLLRSQLLGI